MAVAQGINKKSVIIKQVGLGSAGAGAGGQVLRRITSVFQLDRDTFEANEIVSHQQSTGVTYGQRKPTGKLTGLLSPATYKLLFAALLRKDFVTGVNSTALTNVTAASTSGAQGTFTRAAGSFLTDGFKIGDVVRWTGWATTGASNNSVNMLIIGLTALVMTVSRFDTTAIGAKASGDSVTATVVGKKTLAPLTAQTNDYFTWEEWYSDLSKSELYTDVKVAKIDVGVPANGNATFGAEFVGLDRTLGAAQVLTGPTAETVTPVLNGVVGAVWINGAAYPITSGSITLDGNTSALSPEVGTKVGSDVGRGRIKVSGSFSALFKDTTLQALYDAGTVTSMVLVCLDNPTSGTSSFVSFNLGRLKMTGDAPDDTETQVTRTYPFTAEINSAGGAALANDQTIISVQDSDA